MKYNKKKTNSIAGKISREKTRKTAAQSNCKDNKRATQSADDDSDCEISLRVLRKEIVEYAKSFEYQKGKGALFSPHRIKIDQEFLKFIKFGHLLSTKLENFNYFCLADENSRIYFDDNLDYSSLITTILEVKIAYDICGTDTYGRNYLVPKYAISTKKPEWIVRFIFQFKYIKPLPWPGVLEAYNESLWRVTDIQAVYNIRNRQTGQNFIFSAMIARDGMKLSDGVNTFILYANEPYKDEEDKVAVVLQKFWLPYNPLKSIIVAMIDYMRTGCTAFLNFHWNKICATWKRIFGRFNLFKIFQGEELVRVNSMLTDGTIEKSEQNIQSTSIKIFAQKSQNFKGNLKDINNMNN